MNAFLSIKYRICCLLELFEEGPARYDFDGMPENERGESVVKIEDIDSGTSFDGEYVSYHASYGGVWPGIFRGYRAVLWSDSS